MSHLTMKTSVDVPSIKKKLSIFQHLNSTYVHLTLYKVQQKGRSTNGEKWCLTKNQGLVKGVTLILLLVGDKNYI